MIRNRQLTEQYNHKRLINTQLLLKNLLEVLTVAGIIVRLAAESF